MQRRLLGTSGLSVSRLALGTLPWGTDVDEDEAEQQLSVFLDAGGSLVDTAPSYGAGASETTLGRLLARLGARDEVVLATKAGIERSGGERTVSVSRRALLDSLDRSLDRLDVDNVDLWQVHLWSDDVPIDETLSALDFAVSSGRTRYVGVSNYSGWQTGAAAVHQAAVPGRARLISTQMEYSLLERGIEREVVPAAESLGLGILPWAPLGRGVLTGKYRSGVPGDSRGASGSYAAYVGVRLEQGSGVVEAVCRAAEGLELTPGQVALAWVRDQPGVVAPVVGVRTSEQLEEAVAADGVELPDEIADALDDVSAPQLGYPED